MSVAVNDVFALWPGWNRMSGLLVLDQSPIVDDESEKIAVILQAPKTGAIQYVGLGIGSVTTFPGAGLDIRVETVNTTTGDPTGTLFDTNTNWSGTWSAGAYSVVRFGPLTSNASVSQGDLFAIVYVPPSNPNAGDVDFYSLMDEAYGFPYSKFYNGASWGTTNHRISVALWYTDGGVAIPGVSQVGNMPGKGFNNSDTYDHLGIEMKSNVACEVVGMWAWLDLNGNDTDLKLISGDDTVERSVTLEADNVATTSAQLAYGYFSSSFTAQADTLYRFAAYTAENSDIHLQGYRVNYLGQDLRDVHQSNNWFYALESIKGELTTPAWFTDFDIGNGVYLIGPIVRSIG